ncbi:hypothetical protein lerEdw1_015582 [Lerista edwardsae]|nr:hypothetical protein lerEdw1_015582 [Lerista edwardsae]
MGDKQRKGLSMAMLKRLVSTIASTLGFQDGKEQRSSPGEQDLFAYPWDKSSLKSMPIELKQFEKLDAFAQKVSATSSVESLVSVLLREAHSDLEKVRVIWIWICHHIEYDGASESSEPADVFRSGKSVCAGYAALFEKMCSIAGIGCKYLSGYAKGYSYKERKNVKDKLHAWNAVYINGRWHLVDCTWGSGYMENSKFTFRYNYFYFLTHPAVFIDSHFPKDSKWQLLKPTLSEQEFGSSDRQLPSFFSKQLTAVSQKHATKTAQTPESVLDKLFTIFH